MRDAGHQRAVQADRVVARRRRGPSRPRTRAGPGCRTRSVMPPTSATSVDRAHRRVAAERERGQRERLRHGDELHDDQQLALVGPVGDEAGPGAEHEHRARTGTPRARRPRGRSCRSASGPAASRATIVSQLPTCEISWPKKNRRKLRDVQRLEGGAPGSRQPRSSSVHCLLVIGPQCARYLVSLANYLADLRKRPLRTA